MTSGTDQAGKKKRVVIATFGSFAGLNPTVGLALGPKARPRSRGRHRRSLPALRRGRGERFSSHPDLGPDDFEAVGRIMDPG